MTQVLDQSQFRAAMAERFLSSYHDRHDALEIHLESGTFDEAARVASDIADNASFAGLSTIGSAASMTGTFLREELAQACPDIPAMHNALDAFLDVSLQVCNPTAFRKRG